MAGKTRTGSTHGSETAEFQYVPQREPEENVNRNMMPLDGDESSTQEDLSPLLSRDSEYLRQFDIPIVFNDAVDYFIRYFSVQKRKVFAGWLKRARHYVPMIREILREQGLPEDLVYLAMIESGFNPKAYSPMKACGPWQFIYETGERYGLRVNYWVDERRDPQKSTVAAARYLRDLFNQFGCWYLAAAGYNAGEKRIERAIIKHETNDFWELRKFNALPRETREYIPQLIAAAVIAKDPEKFGFANIPFDAPVSSVSRRVPGGTPLTMVARAAQFDLVSIHSLNPEILRGITPPDSESYLLKLPNTIDKYDFDERLRAALRDGGRVLSVTAHTVKRKDSIARIMTRYRVSQGDLTLVNACGGDFRVKPGSVVYIPRFERDGARSMAARRDQGDETGKRPGLMKTAATTRAGAVGNRGYHITRKGERLSDIARKYRVDVDTLRELNNLKNDSVRPNTRIVLVSGKRTASLFDEDRTNPLTVRTSSPAKTGGTLLGMSGGPSTGREKKKAENTRANRKTSQVRAVGSESRKGRTVAVKTAQTKLTKTRPQKFYHTVKQGENLAGISEKYNANVTNLKKMNGLKKGGVRPGMRLKIASR